MTIQIKYGQWISSFWVYLAERICGKSVSLVNNTPEEENKTEVITHPHTKNCNPPISEQIFISQYGIGIYGDKGSTFTGAGCVNHVSLLKMFICQMTGYHVLFKRIKLQRISRSKYSIFHQCLLCLRICFGWTDTHSYTKLTLSVFKYRKSDRLEREQNFILWFLLCWLLCLSFRIQRYQVNKCPGIKDPPIVDNESEVDYEKSIINMQQERFGR